MSSFVEGGFTVKIDKVSELVAQDKANTELLKAKSYDRNYYATYGPFTVGEYICEVRVSPACDNLNFYLCFLENVGAFKKCGYIQLLQDHNSNSDWTAPSFVRLNQESTFISDRTNITDIKASGLPTIYLGSVSNNDMNKYSKVDCLVVKFLIWVLLDDSKIGPPKPTQQSDKKANQPNNSPPDFISTLLAGQLADVDFIVNDQTFSAHRAILAARSSVFKSEFFALDDETRWNKLQITVQHMDALTFKCVLHFIYTDSMPSDFEATTRKYQLIFIAAHWFKIEGLKSICEEKLTKAVTDSMVLTLELKVCGQELDLLKIVPKDSHMKQEIIATSTSVRKALLGDRVYDSSDKL